MGSTGRRRVVLAAAVAALAAGGVAYAAGTKPSAKATKVTVTETEFKLALSKATFKPGAYIFVVVNKGTVTHSLAVSGPGVKSARLKSNLQPGATGSLTVTLKNGKYTLRCPIDGHAASGMKLSLTVSTAGGQPTPAPASTTGTDTTGGSGGYGSGYGSGYGEG
jgi:plastocyanin